MKNLFQIILFLFCFQAASQESEVISNLQEQFKKHTKEDTVRAQLLNDLAWEYSYFDPEQGLEFARHAIALSNKLNYENGKAEAYNVMGICSRALNRFDSAHYYLNRALDIRTRQRAFAKASAVKINIANIYMQQLKYSDAIIKYNDAIKMALEHNYAKSAMVGLTNLADAYRSAGLHDKSLQTLKKALDINKAIKDSMQEPYIYSSLAIILNEMGNTEGALTNGRKALSIMSSHPDVFLKISVLNNMGIYTRNLRQTDSSFYFYTEAIKLEEANNDSLGLGISYNGLAILYQGEKQFDLCLAYAEKSRQISVAMSDTASQAKALLIMADVYSEKSDFTKALTFALQAEPLMLSHDNPRHLYELYESLAIIYKGLKQHDKRAECLEKMLFHRDKMLSEEARQASAGLTIEMDVYGKQKEIELLNKNSQLKEAELSKQKTAKKFITGIAALFGVIVLVIVFFYFKIRKSNIIINKQKERVEAQNDIILHQKQIVEEKQKEIIDSITYAKRIQSAVLTGDDIWSKVSKDYFIFFQPKDIVSGDFYWAYNTPNNRSVFVLADCTGHGVPGGFMSMLGNSFLNEIVVENKIFSASSILNKLREKIISALEQQGEEQRRDGMDMALCVWNKLNNTLEFAGANNGLTLVRKNSLFELKPDKMPIGTYVGDLKPFSSQTIQLEAGDCVYMATDGFPDQFGGPKGKKFKYKQFSEALLSVQTVSMKEQGDLLRKLFNEWKGDLEQIDDVSVIGLRVP